MAGVEEKGIGVEVHPLAKCCWCGASFMRGPDVVEAEGGLLPWVCPVHWQRQFAYAMYAAVKGKSGKACRFVPLPRQVDALDALYEPEGPTYVLIGGAAGGSKSRGLREIAHRECMRVAGFRVLLLRRTFRELDQTHLRDVELEAPEMGAVAVPSAKVVRYPNGSVLQFGHCETSADAANYLSAEYDLIIFDELVTFEELQFLLIASRARSTKAGVKPKILAGTNPGGPQSHWVKSRFIDRTVDLEQYPDYQAEDYRYIPSKLDDNPYLDQAYEKKLLALPPELRRAYREGDWDIFPGQYFPEFRRATHVTAEPIKYPDSYARVEALDWGFVKPGAWGSYVQLPDGGLYLEDEYIFTRTIASDVAKEIKRRRQERGGRTRYMVGDTSMWTPDSQTGESIAETFSHHGVPMIQADKDRLNGWQRYRHWLRISPNGTPWYTISPLCTYTARTIPAAISDKHKPEDVDTDGEDHSLDRDRYMFMSRPAPIESGVPPVAFGAGSVGALIAAAKKKTARMRWGRVA